MSDQPITQESLRIVLSGLLASGDAERQALYKQWADTPACRDAMTAIENLSPEKFYFSLLYPFNQLVNGLVEQAIPGQRKAHFLLTQFEFVRAHFRRIIEARDGFACCADKTRAVLSRLLAFYISGKEIVFDLNEKYTFHHPTNIFTTHDAIVEFFEALYRLHSGMPDLYLAALKKIYVSQDVSA